MRIKVFSFFRALFDPNVIQSQVKWIWRLKILFLHPSSLDLLLSHRKNWLVVRIISPGQRSWNSGLWDKVMRTILLHLRMLYLILTKCNGRKSMHNYAAYYGNLLIPKFYIIFVSTKPALNFGFRLKDYTRMIFNDFISGFWYCSCETGGHGFVYLYWLDCVS